MEERERYNYNKKFSITKRCRSFKFAFNGLLLFLRTQHNAWIHIMAIAIVLGAGFFLRINALDWCLLAFAIGFVLSAEIFNTAIEFLTDIVSPDYDEKAGKVKDLAAAGVLIAAVTAAIIGGIVFLPKIIKYFV